MPTLIDNQDLDSSAVSLDVFGSIIDTYRREGFEAGYRRAKTDLLAELALEAAEFFRNQPSPSSELRNAIRVFISRIEQSLGNELEPSNYVEGGLGI